MLTVLSLMDDRSRPKGSRDPLGIEAVWSFMGRKVVGNLTTVTSNLDNFMVALLCCHHANTRSDQLDNVQTAFLRAEQLAAYLRLSGGEEGFLGITRAKANFKSSQLPLGQGEAVQILSNQLSYGLWGLYSTAMKVAGLIDGPDRRLTDQGNKLVCEMIAFLGEANWQEFQEISEVDLASMESVKALAPAFNGLLRDSQLRASVVKALLQWEAAQPLQLELYRFASQYLNVSGASLSVSVFCHWLLEQQDTSDALRATIQQIQSLEPLLVLAGSLMEWLQGQKDCKRAELLDVLQPRLENLALADDWQALGGLPHRAFLKRLFDAAINHDAEALINGVLEQNKLVMQQRGGAAWLEWQGDVLRVRVANDRALIPDNLHEHCHGRWWNSYFIGSFLQIARQAV